MLSSVFEPTHLALILVIALIVLGPKRLPAAGRALGSGISNFKQGLAHPEEPSEVADGIWRP